MKQLFLLLLVLLCASLAFASAGASESLEAQKILDNNCSKCHGRDRIEQAMAAQRDMLEIQQRMLKHGAELNPREQQVLGIFFRDYAAEKSKPAESQEDPLAEYRSVVEARCTGCHSLAVIETAMQQKREFASLAQMMIKRGAVLNDNDMKIIQTFWGQPLK